MNKSLIVYFSYTNNTREIVNMINKEYNYDVLELKTKVPYSDNYDLVVTQGQEEVDNNYKPELENFNLDLANYDTIILGTPVWWYTYAPALNTFLSNYDLSGKKIIPFMTNGGWLGHTLEDIKRAQPNCEVTNSLAIKFDGNTLISDQVTSWINSLRR